MTKTQEINGWIITVVELCPDYWQYTATSGSEYVCGSLKAIDADTAIQAAYEAATT